MPVMPGPGVDYIGGVPGQAHGPVGLKWDPKNLEIRTTSVERTLEPLVIQVTGLRMSCRSVCLLLKPNKCMLSHS